MKVALPKNKEIWSSTVAERYRNTTKPEYRYSKFGVPVSVTVSMVHLGSMKVEKVARL